MARKGSVAADGPGRRTYLVEFDRHGHLVPGTDPSAYEFDHLISLELGGAPSDIRNLWPEANYAPSFSYRKDGLENSLNARVCNRTIFLAAAQRRIVHWVYFVSTSGTETPAPSPTPTPTPTGNCDPAYPRVCIPPPPPDLDCGEIPYRNFKVLPPVPVAIRKTPRPSLRSHARSVIQLRADVEDVYVPGR